MQLNSHNRWWSRTVTFTMAALVSASAAYWLLQWPEAGGYQTPFLAATNVVPSDPQDLVKLLGRNSSPTSAAPVTSASSRFVLAGVVAIQSRSGAALIAIDGKPAQPYRVGSTVDEGLLLQSVAARRAVLATSLGGPAAMILEMKPLPK